MGRLAQEARARVRAREEQRIRDDLATLTERVRDSELPDRDMVIGHLGQAARWARRRQEHDR